MIVAKTTSGLNSDRTVWQYTHGLLLESSFVPSSIDCWAIQAKIGQNGRLSGHRAETEGRNMVVTQKNLTFWPSFPIHSIRQFLTRTYRFTTIQNVTDRQTDRQTDKQTDRQRDRQAGRRLGSCTPLSNFRALTFRNKGLNQNSVDNLYAGNVGLHCTKISEN